MTKTNKLLKYLKILFFLFVPMYLIWGTLKVLRIPVYSNFNIKVYDRYNKYVCNIKSRNCKYLPYNKIPLHLQKKIFIVEDINFFTHPGVSLTSIIRSIFLLPYFLLRGQRPPGGSTITQQLVRSWFLTNQISVFRKINEIFLSILFSVFYSKKKVFEFYFNNIYFGNGIYGFEQAARSYFGKTSDSLNTNQAATLISMIKSSFQYSPMFNTVNLMHRKKYILQRWFNFKIITQNQYNSYSNMIPYVLPFFQPTRSKLIYSHLYNDICEFLQKKTKQKYSKDQIKSVYLTIDDNLQNKCSYILDKYCKKFEASSQWKGPIGKVTHYTHIKQIVPSNLSNEIMCVMIQDKYGNYKDSKGKQGKLPEEAILKYTQYHKILPGDVVLFHRYRGHLCNIPSITGQVSIIGCEKHNMGQVLASIGTHNWKENNLNFSNVPKPISSCLKIFMLACFFQEEIAQLNSTVYDFPGICYKKSFFYVNRSIFDIIKNKDFDLIWVPKNWDNHFLGKITLLDAFCESRNIPFLMLGLNYIGLDKINTFLLNMNILKRKVNYPSLILGSCWDISMEDFITKCCIFSNNGIPVEKQMIKSFRLVDGLHTCQQPLHQVPQMTQETIYQVLFAMKYNSSFGLSSIVHKLPYENIYLKTGTSAGVKDLHCIVFTKQYAISLSVCDMKNISLRKRVSQKQLLDLVSDLLESLQIKDEPIMKCPYSMKTISIPIKSYGDQKFFNKKYVVYKKDLKPPTIVEDFNQSSIDNLDELYNMISI